MKIAIATVFIPRENIFWIEEWIRYHLFHIGIDTIYLYDNTGSLKLDHLPFAPEIAIALSGKNLRGEDIASHTAHLSDAQIESIVEKIVEKYVGRVVVVPWHPIDKDGVPYYGQREAWRHFLENNGRSFDWACLTDIDEFIVNANFKEKILSFDRRGYNCVVIHPKLFLQRFNENGPIVPVLSITDCVKDMTDRNWKQVVKCSETLYPDVHQGGEWRGEWNPRFDSGITFYHYKVGSWYYRIMRNKIAFCPRVIHIGTDSTLKEIIPLLNLEENVQVPLPTHNTMTYLGPRKIKLPSVSFKTRIILIKQYLAVCALMRYPYLRKVRKFLGRPSL